MDTMAADVLAHFVYQELFQRSAPSKCRELTGKYICFYVSQNNFAMTRFEVYLGPAPGSSPIQLYQFVRCCPRHSSPRKARCSVPVVWGERSQEEVPVLWRIWKKHAQTFSILWSHFVIDEISTIQSQHFDLNIRFLCLCTWKYQIKLQMLVNHCEKSSIEEYDQATRAKSVESMLFFPAKWFQNPNAIPM